MLDSGFQSPGFWIPRAKNSWIPESGFPYMGRVSVMFFCNAVSRCAQLVSFLCRMIMLIALVSIFIVCTHCPALNSLASFGQYSFKFICLLMKFLLLFLLLLLLLIAELSGRHRQSPIFLGGEDQSLRTRDTLSIGPVDTH